MVMDHRVLVKELLKIIAMERPFLDRRLAMHKEVCDNIRMAHKHDPIIQAVLTNFFAYGLIAGSIDKAELVEEYIHNFGRADVRKWT